ncbi:putative membrane protein [Plasmodium coatneyi]|uniref:Putative membrane protein n=1 Tax=Plasmodium coatneyi TaxID=208452 RepID=A0A1B1E4K6_9APIC|nr:putative membrane protein [Plasmodium coatneyi]ANQ09926.1 putative membrane protein [Plasmodium coatneyi]
MIPPSHECKSQKEEERRNHLNDQVVRDNTNGRNVCSFPQGVKNVGWDDMPKESEGNPVRCVSEKDGHNGCAMGRVPPCDDSRCNNIVAKKKKKPFLHELCKNYVKLTLHRPCCIVLSVIIGLLIVTLMSISFYMNIFSEAENRSEVVGSIMRKINGEKFTKMNVAKASDVVIHTSDNIGNKVEHFFNFYKKEKTATLLFYLNKEEDKTILQYDTLKDIFFLVQFFKQMNTGNKKNWSEMCKRFDVPMMESKCFVLGLFTISELQDIEYDTTLNWEEYFDDLLKKDERSLGRFFYNALIFLPNFLYQPHKFDMQRTQIKDITSDMSKNVEALLFVFTFDEGTDDSSVNEWYSLLNMHVKLINAGEKEFVTIENLDGSNYIHEIKQDRNWSMAVVNEKVLEDNEQSSISVGFKSNYVFAILSFLFMVIYISSIPLDGLKNNGQDETAGDRKGRMFLLILSVYALTFFSFFSTFFINLVFQINVLRIYLLNFFPLFFLSFLFCCVNIFYRNKCVVGPSKMIMRRMRSAKISKNESVDMTKYYLRASYKSLYFVCKITLIILAVYMVGFASTYRIVNVFSVNSVFAIVCLFLYYAAFFNNMFGLLFYRERHLLFSPSQSLPLAKSVCSSSGGQSDEHVIAFSEAAPNEVVIQNGCISSCNSPPGGNNTCQNAHCSCEGTNLKKHHRKSCIHPNGKEDSKKASYRKGPKKGVVFLVVLFSLLLLGLFLSFLINNEKIHLDVYHYMTKESPLRRFIQNFEKRAGFVIEPAYLVFPSSDEFDYADEENAHMIIKLVNEMKEEGCIHEPIVSWVHAFELLKNDCRNVDSFSNQFDLNRYKKLCHDIVPLRESKEHHLNKLKEIFFKEEEKTCDSFYQIVYEWMHHKEEESYDNQFFKIKTFYGGKIDQVLPQHYNIRPHSFYGDYVKMDDPHSISTSRIGFVLHNYASNQERNMENINRIENIIKRSNLKNVYFYSETYVLYNQATRFISECKVVLIFYFLIYLFSLYLFNTMGVVMIFQFWLCYNLSVLYFMHSFGINTDAITIILLKMGAVISLSHYLYQTLFFKSTMLDRKNYSNSMRQSYPYLMFLVLYLISFTLEDYASNVLRLLILNHVVWFFLYSITIFYVHKMYLNRA